MRTGRGFGPRGGEGSHGVHEQLSVGPVTSHKELTLYFLAGPESDPFCMLYLTVATTLAVAVPSQVSVKWPPPDTDRSFGVHQTPRFRVAL